MSQKESDWDEKLREKWLGANICYGCTGGCAISSRMMDEIIEDVSVVLSTREKEIAEEVEKIIQEERYSGAPYALNKVLQILKH